MMPAPDSAASNALDEETARSELYGLLALLYYAPPATELIAKLRVAATDAQLRYQFGSWWRIVQEGQQAIKL